MYVDIFVKAWHTCDLQLSVNSLLLEWDFFLPLLNLETQIQDLFS